MSSPVPIRSERRHTASSGSIPFEGYRSSSPFGAQLVRTASSDTPIARSFVSPLHNHLYTSGFLQSELSDVRISAHGRIYNLHRLVLAQSDFFRSLLAGGFSEEALSADPFAKTAVVPLQFDANCSRAAFEFCIARIYGGGPELVLSSTSRPDPARGYPLTEVFARQAAHQRPADEPLYDPNEVQMATPSFLLSLLATSLYLELPAIASETIQLIFNSITPYTVSIYLRFALGEGVPGPLGDEPCAGLAAVSSPVAIHHKSPMVASPAGGWYGEHAERIGEACACWMARWASDVLPVEESQDPSASPAIRVFSWSGVGGIPSEWLRALLASDSLWIDRGDSLIELGTSSERQRYDMAKKAIELRRRQKRAVQVRAELLDGPPADSADDADSVTEGSKQTRRAPRVRQATVSSIGEFDDDETEYERLFAEGIYFSHLVRSTRALVFMVKIAQPFATLQELMTDLSASTGQPFVSPTVLFRAHWDASRLRSLFPLLPPGGAYIEDADKTRAALGISLPFETRQTVRPALAPSSQRRWVVPIDETVRINEGHAMASAMGGDYDAVSPPIDPPFSTSPLGHGGKPVMRSKPGAWQPAERFFGLANPAVSLGENLAGLETRQYVPFEPFRFSIEFWDIDQLREKQRLYSHTVSYAGSSYNVYLQVLRKTKGRMQLGIYLHRQSPHASIPAASKPPTLTAAEIASNPIRTVVESDHDRDPRSNVKAFFSLTVQNLAGTSSTRFASAPDSFSLSQSWGWKSSSLRGDDYLVLIGPDDAASPSSKADAKRAARYTSLRCSVTMGLV